MADCSSVVILRFYSEYGAFFEEKLIFVKVDPSISDEKIIQEINRGIDDAWNKHIHGEEALYHAVDYAIKKGVIKRYAKMREVDIEV